MNYAWPPQDQVFWYLKRDGVIPCHQNQSADVIIIGGGMAGLSAAQAFHKKGKKVIILEQYYCGSGASGKSSGFITPNAELSFTDFTKRYNKHSARKIWDFIISGVQDIHSNIHDYNFSCGYNAHDALVVANSKSEFKALEIEYGNLIEQNYKTTLYSEISLRDYVGSSGYHGGVRYENSFSINAYAYCQEMKKHLEAQGVVIFEETPVLSLQDHTIKTPSATTLTAEHIIVCCDRFLPDLGLLKKEVYHAQTFIMLSSALADDQIKTIFPQEPLMVWDTDLIYNYFRLTHDNRLLVGGGTLMATYSPQESHNYKPIVTKLSRYLKKKFPELDVQFEHVWPGLIGISKDIGPIAGRDKDNNHIYYITAATGLPIAAALGRYSAEHMLDGNTDLDAYFSPYRSFPIGGLAQTMLGTRATFALSNFFKHHVP